MISTARHYCQSRSNRVKKFISSSWRIGSGKDVVKVLKALWIFFIFLSGNTFFTITTFWQIKNAKNLTLNFIFFGIKFQSLWTFWLGYCAILLPAVFVINYAFLYAYWYGYNVAFEEKAWSVQIIIWLQSVLVMFFVSWLYLGELPARNMMVALLFLLGAVAAIIWR